MLFLIKSAAFAGASTMIGLMLVLLCLRRPFAAALKTRLIVLQIYIIATAFLSPNLITYDILAGLIVPFFASERRLIAPIYMFAMLSLPAPEYQMNVAGIYLLSMNAVTALSIGAIVTALACGDSRTGRGWSPAGICVTIIFLVYVWPSIRSTTFTNILRVVLEQGLTVIVPFLIIRRSVKTLDDIKLLLVGMLAAGAALSTLAIYEAMHFWPIYRVVSDHFGVVMNKAAFIKMRGGLLRAPGPYVEPLSFAVQLSVLALLAFTGRWMFRVTWQHQCVIALLLAGLFAPQSRSAWIGLGFGLLISALLSGRTRSVATAFILVPTLGVLGFVFGRVVPFIGNMLGMDSSGTVARDYRQDLFTRGMEEARKHMLFGQNIDVVMYNLRDLAQGEGIVDFVNSYLYVLLLTGLVGLIPFFLSLATPIGALWRRRGVYRANGSAELAYVGGAIAAMILMIAFTGFFARSQVTVVVLIALVGVVCRVTPPALDAARRVTGPIPLLARDRRAVRSIPVARLENAD